MEKVLVIEDDEHISAALKLVLESEGYNIAFSEDGEQGIDMINSFNPDIILLDIMLSQKNGFEVCSSLRSNEEYSSIPVIMMSSYGETNNIVKCFQIGANDFVSKPFNMQELLARVKSHLLLKELNYEKRKLKEKVIEHSIEGVTITDAQGSISYVNPAFSKVTGYSAEEVIGKNPNILQSGRHGKSFYQHMWGSLLKYGKWQGEIWNRRKGGEVYPQMATITAIKNSDGVITNYAAMFYDMTEIKKNQKEIEYRAYYDSLTKIPNRQLFLDRLTQAINRAKREEHMVGVFFIDLDNFKHINDSLGHATGDIVLREVAKRLSNCAREVDTVSRLAGDEFSVIQDDLVDIEEAGVVAKRIIDALSHPFHHENNELFTTVSIGIAIYPLNGETSADILRNADMAMYHVKDFGKNHFQFFTDSLNEKAMKRRDLEDGLRKAINDDNFLVYYQPKVDLKSGKMVALEALARWPRNGTIVSPTDFIPIAETTGLITSLDKLILQKTCSFIKKMQETISSTLNVSINLSTKDLENLHLIRDVMDTIKRFGVKASNLELEVTESMIIRNVESAIKILQEFRDEGFSLSIDDFGTGYSSLSYLTKFPLSILKIDKAFIDDLESNENSQSIAKAIVYMAHAMKMLVIAEGVETQGQLDFLRSIGCDQIQGYIFSKPLPEDEVVELIKSGKTLSLG